MKAPVSVIILTYNEELHLERCLLSVVFWADEVIIVDSGSKDRTQAIAKKYGARFYEHEFTNQAEQFNWALKNVEINSPWIFRLDADEYVTPELADEIQYVTKKDNSMINGYEMKRRVFFMGRWIKHGGYYPLWFVRLFRRGHGKYEQREMDEHLLVDGEVGSLKHDFVDHNLQSLGDWTAKHNNYATREANAYLKHRVDAEGFGALGSGQVESKRWLKQNVYYRTPPFLRAFFYYIWRYFFKLGFLDGKVGLIFHFLHAFWYRFLVDAKIYEFQRIK